MQVFTLKLLCNDARTNKQIELELEKLVYAEIIVKSSKHYSMTI